MRVLLCTNNIGRVFDAGDECIEWWLNNLDDTVTSMNADFVALHLQELAGNAFKKGTANMSDIQRLADAVRTRFHDFWCSGIFAPSVADGDFTALGCIVLVRRSSAPQVALFEFGASAQSGSRWRPVSTLDEPLLPAPSLPARWCRHGSFPRHFFDSLVPTWTRKGWLHTRWRVDGQPLDLLNVHLFHDDDNLVALRRTSALSDYASCRHNALQYALALLAADGPPLAALGPLPAALCVFGDFNFRLDLRRVTQLLAGGDEALLRELATLAEGAATSVRVAIRPSPVAPPPPPPPLRVLSLSSAWRCLLCIGRQQVLAIGAKRFEMEDIARFAREASAFRRCDVEVAACAELQPALREVEGRFPPTYGYRDAATSSCEQPAFDGKRCPSWTDRVLLDEAGMRLLRATSDVSYGALDQGVVRNDHNMVFLAFSLNPSASLGGEPVGVRVLASQGAASKGQRGAGTDGASKPAAWRVKAVTEVVVEC